jgi:hypothetical protein
MPRKDSVSLRLSNAFKFWTDSHRCVLAIVDYEDGEPTGDIHIIEDAGDSIKAKAFTGLVNLPLLSPMTAAFKAAGLDPTSPLHWYELILLFSWAHFGDRRKSGAPRKWDSLRYCKLIEDFSDKKRSNPALSDDDVFRFLAKTASYRTAKGPLSTSRLRKALKEANDPDCNQLLSGFQLSELDELQEDAGTNDPAQSLPERDHDE